eukprot:TRINITY_DN3654_c0_g1_i3.p1 TRINITY_DN3654_c0_g1~~TRINITY_DN3654_c0_g1_i3.p1  ORF type:complete len:126 (-),score=2.13 TRINITY_DN3654_c0_g1_i3:338-715(-)
MVHLWLWGIAGAAPAAYVVRSVLRGGNGRQNSLDREERLRGGGRDRADVDPFVCERVCTSSRMLNKVGAFSKDPTPNTCVTVCGVSAVDACTEACRRSVCVNAHHVPNWNDVCMRRCSEECLKAR